MVFTWILGIIGTFYSVLGVGGFPTTADMLSGFILGALIDMYILIKKSKA